MSWYVSAKGMSDKVADAVNRQLAAVRCAEPEETIKTLSAELIGKCLAAFPQHHPVGVEASGSQSKDDSGVVNSLSITISPMHGFLK